MADKITEYIGEFSLEGENSPKGTIVMKNMFKNIENVQGEENEKICRAELTMKNRSHIFYFSHEKCNDIRVLWDSEEKPQWKITEESISS